MYEAKDIWVQHGLGPRVNTCLQMIWLRRVEIFLDYKIAYSKNSECTELLGWFSPADAMHTRYFLDPIKIYATKRKVSECKYRLDTMGITEIGESQAMLIMVKDIYINNLKNVSTDIDRMHIDLEFWNQQHTLDSDAHHLNRHMIDIIQEYIRGDATQMELGALVYKHRSCKGIFTQRLLTPNAIQSMHADYLGLPDDTLIDSSPNASNQKIKLLEEKVTTHDSEQSSQTISRILNSEGTGIRCINQNAPLMSEQNQLSPDWVIVLEGETVICEDATTSLSTSLPILEGCLNVTCVQSENGKPFSSTDSAQSAMASGADTDSDLARPSGGKHPSSRHATPSMLLRSATRRRTADHVVAHSGPRDSE
jgi:hypothetical protein